MDLQADEARLGPDPHVTAVFHRPRPDDDDGTGSQGQLFADAYPTYADTDKIPATGRGGTEPRRRRTSRLLRFAVVVVAVAVVGAGVALGLVQAKVIDGGSNGGTTSPPTHAATGQHPHAATLKGQLATQVSTGNGTATYTIAIAAYSVTVSTSTGRSWVSIGAPGQKASFAGILEPNSSQKQILLGPSEVDVGAGGTKLTITSGHRTTTLTPPSAPFQYQFLIKKS
jgi:hypothetical protein